IREESDRYLVNGRDFIDDNKLQSLLRGAPPDAARVRGILAKAREINTLEPAETAALLNVSDPVLWDEMFAAAAEVKRRVYDNRVVTFAPLYCSNLCVNNCLYCGFRSGNSEAQRRCLSLDEIRRETEVLAGEIGHKRLVLVYGEHPSTGAEYIAETMRAVYGVKVKTGNGAGEIRRVNLNAAPLCVADYRLLKQAGIGTFQIFQETYHRATYARVHPAGTVKSDYRWRLYGLHRAQEAGVDDVAIGALFGLYDWKFETLGLLEHARDMEKRFGIGPHTVSVPRLEPACGNELSENSPYRVSDEDFKKLVCVLRLSIPYAGLIVTVREKPEIIRSVLPMCTQRDASTRIGIGAYSDRDPAQKSEKQQFILGDTRSLDEVIRELADTGHITSFCTAGYRCGRTGDHIMNMLRTGREGRFCKLNAVLTFREWLDDFASPQTKAAGERVIAAELAEIKARAPGEFSGEMLATLNDYYARIRKGERDLCF
ncbi:MAG: [FeFe] hydrogenase H-cluster radical SAM maturase HydG, partial [Elusimicrobiaceae bacterium]|nr:[FeFe] hydrogenase H-cluster radical SAM maturase HydG [Elusimicrobiaceae bacterium]